MKARIIKNISSQFICYILQLVTSVILAILLGKLLGPQGLGRFTFVTTFAIMFAFLCDWGLSLFIIREIARAKDKLNIYVNNSIGLSLLFSCIALCVISLILSFSGFSLSLKLDIYLATIWMILGVLISFPRAAFHAFERMKFEALTLAVEKIFLLAIVPFVLFFRRDLTLVLFFMIFSRLLNILVSFIIYKRNFGFIKPEFNWGIWKLLLKAAFPFGLNILFSNIYLSSDVVLLGLLRTEAETGLYRAATAVVLPLGVIALSVNNSLFPIFSRGHVSSRESFSLGLAKALEYLSIVGFFLTVVLFVFSKQIVTLCYTREFLPSVIAIKILSLLVPLRFINNTLAVAATAADRQRNRTISVAIGALANVLMNIFIIPRFGYIGASITTIITDIIIFTLLAFFIFEYISVRSIFKAISKPLICSIAMGALFILLKQAVPFFAIVVIIPFCYFALLYSIKGISKQGFNDFLSLLVRIK